jgi:hypothetical protein
MPEGANQPPAARSSRIGRLQFSTINERKTSMSHFTEIKTQIKDIEAQRETLTLEITPEALALVLDHWRNQIIQANQSNDIAAVKVLLSCFIERVEVNPVNVTIKYKYPIQTLMATSTALPSVGAPL